MGQAEKNPLDTADRNLEKFLNDAGVSPGQQYRQYDQFSGMMKLGGSDVPPPESVTCGVTCLAARVTGYYGPSIEAWLNKNVLDPIGTSLDKNAAADPFASLLARAATGIQNSLGSVVLWGQDNSKYPGGAPPRPNGLTAVPGAIIGYVGTGDFGTLGNLGLDLGSAVSG